MCAAFQALWSAVYYAVCAVVPGSTVVCRMQCVLDYLEDGLALMLLLPGPLLHEGIQQQLAHMNDGQAGVRSGLLHRGPPLAPSGHRFLQLLDACCPRWQALQQGDYLLHIRAAVSSGCNPF